MADANKMIKLVQQAQNGNVNAYGRLIEYYKEYLYKTAWLYVGNEQESLDVVQDSVLKGFRQIKTLKEPKYFKTWMTRILINSAKDTCKKRQHVSEEYLEASIEVTEDSGKEERMDLHNAIGRLPEVYRSVIILRYFNEMKLGEIGTILGIPSGTVSAYLTRAKQELRKYLKEDYLYE